VRIGADAPLPTTSTTENALLRIVSYNCMIPNSVDGWWIHKCYVPHAGDAHLAHTSWATRQALIEATLAATDADVVCIQEASECSSIDDDFAFLLDKGFKYAMGPKGRMRCVTFWRESAGITLVTDAVGSHRDVIVPLCVGGVDGVGGKDVWIVNVHLPAGSASGSRQLQSLDAAFQKLRKAYAVGGCERSLFVFFTVTSILCRRCVVCIAVVLSFARASPWPFDS
jgi:hypothetical protein